MTESGAIEVHDDEAGLHISVRVEDVPEGAAAKRLQSILELVQYHRFQNAGREVDDAE